VDIPHNAQQNSAPNATNTLLLINFLIIVSPPKPHNGKHYTTAYHNLQQIQKSTFKKIRPSFLGRIVLLYKINYLDSLIAACGAISKSGKY
jgi:hypothetical protein